MTGKPAAFFGRLTQHPGPVTGPGSPDVLVHNLPAWAATVPHACPIHGPEVVVAGSETVLINGKFAARAGDFLQGSGPPNRIMEMPGMDDVLIGTPPIGVQRPENVSTFCQAYCALKRDWPNLSPEERERRYRELLAQQFATFGAPPPSVADTAPPGTNATWDANRWQVAVGQGMWTSSSPPAASTTLHETAHAQQTFLGMRSRGGDSGSQTVPEHVRTAAASQPLEADSAEGRYGSLHANNELDHAGLENRSQIIRNYHAAWAANPSASDPGVRAAALAYAQQPGGQDGAEAGTAAGTCGCP